MDLTSKVLLVLPTFWDHAAMRMGMWLYRTHGILSSDASTVIVAPAIRSAILSTPALLLHVLMVDAESTLKALLALRISLDRAAVRMG